jgi:predicted PurR-regulated permease PerM
MATQPNPDFLLCLSRGFLLRLIAFAALVLVLLYAGRVLLIIFAALLLSIILRTITDQLHRILSINEHRAYVIVICALFLIAGSLTYILGPQVITQAHEIAKTIPESLAQIQSELDRYDWGRDLTGIFTRAAQSTKDANANQLAAYASDVVESITDGVIIIAVALFVGGNPSLYRSGFLQLVPAKHRSTAADLFKDVGVAVKGWLLGQLVPMAVLGIGTLVGLWIMGVPLAFTLALLTALMLFVPYVGSIIAFVPTVLVALTQGPMKMVYVTILYLGVHIAEAYVITPIAQRRAVRLPPALTLISQLFMWIVAGVLGVVVATPLAAVGLVVVQRLYLKKKPSLQN